MSLDPTLVRHGRVNGRYFRENFAQGGIDLVQIVPELVTNADAAIASAAGVGADRAALRRARPGFVARLARAMRRLRAPALLDWRHELRCSDDGDRDGRRGGRPAARSARRERRTRAGSAGCSGAGLRDVWLAQGGGRIEGVRDGRLVESWFFPVRRRRPVRLRPRPRRAGERGDAAELGLDGSGTRDHGAARGRAACPPIARLRALVAQLVQLRPVLEDPDARAVARAARRAGRSSSRCRRPSPTASARCCSTTRSRSARDVRAA